MMKLTALSLFGALFNKANAQTSDNCPPGSNLLWLDVHVDLDLYAQDDDTSWTLTNVCTGEVLIEETADNFGLREETHEGWCLNPYNHYRFTIADHFGDGLGTGEYRILWDGDTLAQGNRAWRFEDTATFGDDVCFGTSMLVPLVAGSGGDPHFKTFTGRYYDFHGACDLVLMSIPSYGDGQGLELHVRTAVRYDYSFISSAALRVGDDIFEVSGWGEFVVNGITGYEAWPLMLSDLATVNYVQQEDKRHVFEIQLDKDSKIIFSTFKDWVSVSIDFKSLDAVRDVVGMVGSTSGKLLARDGKTNLGKDLIAFGKEWQVREDESKLFQHIGQFPQYPQACVMPGEETQQDRRRRLGERNSISQEQARVACVRSKRIDDMKSCVFDVIASGDLDMAQANGF